MEAKNNEKDKKSGSASSRFNFVLKKTDERLRLYTFEIKSGKYKTKPVCIDEWEFKRISDMFKRMFDEFAKSPFKTLIIKGERFK